MFFLITHYNGESSDEGYLLEEVSGLPRVVSMGMNLSMFEPVRVITESKRVAAVLDRYGIEHQVIQSEMTNFEKVGKVSEEEGCQLPVSIFTPERFLEDQSCISSLLENYERNKEELKKNQFAVITFFTSEEDARLGRDVSFSIGSMGGVEGFVEGFSSGLRQVEFYVLNPSTLRNLNILERRREFVSLEGSSRISEQRKLIYYSIPLLIAELKGIGERDRGSKKE